MLRAFVISYYHQLFSLHFTLAWKNKSRDLVKRDCRTYQLFKYAKLFLERETINEMNRDETCHSIKTDAAEYNQASVVTIQFVLMVEIQFALMVE